MGDPVALAAFETLGGWLGQGLADLAAVLDPETFIVGGGVSEAGDLFLEPAIAAFSARLTGGDRRPVATVEMAQLGNDAGLVGAADLARESSQATALTRRRRRRRRLGRPVPGRSYAARVWRSL